jgi:hypothetical protein
MLIEYATCAQQILMGLNFYGWQFSKQGKQDAVLGRDFKKLVDGHPGSLKWDSQVGEYTK